MSDSQILAMLAAPVMSPVIVIAGYIVQNANLDARVGELRQEFNLRLTTEVPALRTEMKAQADTFRTELSAIRTEEKAQSAVVDAELRAIHAEMSKNHSELLGVIRKHDHPIVRG
jgi:hypothetical protein